MNITPLTIYLWQLTDHLKEGLVVLMIFSGIYTAIRLIFYLHCLDDCRPTRSLCEDKQDIPARQEHAQKTLPSHRRDLKLAFILTLGFTLLRSLTPTSNTIAMMVIIPRISESKVIQQDLPDIYNAAISALKKQLTQEK